MQEQIKPITGELKETSATGQVFEIIQKALIVGKAYEIDEVANIVYDNMTTSKKKLKTKDAYIARTIKPRISELKTRAGVVIYPSDSTMQVTKVIDIANVKDTINKAKRDAAEAKLKNNFEMTTATMEIIKNLYESGKYTPFGIVSKIDNISLDIVQKAIDTNFDMSEFTFNSVTKENIIDDLNTFKDLFLETLDDLVTQIESL